MPQITANFVKHLKGWRGDARLYSLSERVGYAKDTVTGDFIDFTDHIIVSSVVVMLSGPETFIFPADANGEVLEWGEMEGSITGVLEHAAAIYNAGWALA